ncbi:hypothetical protein SARC_03599 [Sphaeroforma arctica JP610]|uniref:Fatty acid hydroxylase domain-containing protein n=1 Tax=Sphaeroforma arctica JP610 TaxID=667725 RepID=A0A0L0G565_9EUKA|nr:hypothetical protein SARC_03599 [Sphaeroforma arctica JP610]KNC84177.1 hypothetical protein SARC_03599 [Sphaeroforma arctica JP610]|eukprot:XP_014158079.1 hypothetical protein SARC_03599 [Sphaeroforma arctica JP610]
MLYDDVEEYGFPYLVFSMLAFLMFVDFGIYWIHRGLHIPIVYKYIHKLHHKWLVPTPFASHAFNWLDGFSQSSPYHIFVFIVPLHKTVDCGSPVARQLLPCWST